jgi:Kef-type K+ transport system membrane component KefB
MILGAAIIDDIAGIILLTLLVGLVKPGASSSVGVVTLKIVAFFAILYTVGFVVVKFLRKIKDDVVGDEQIIVFSIILCFILAFMSEEFGVAAITGAYFAGVIFSMTSFKHRVSHDVNKVSNLLFTPIFFVGIGMDINLSAAATAVGVGSLLIVMGIIGKIVGCGLGARLSGFTLDDSLQIGVGMVPRAEVAIIVANLGLQMAILSEKDMAATVVMVLVTTLLTPSMLKWTFNRVHKSVA